MKKSIRKQAAHATLTSPEGASRKPQRVVTTKTVMTMKRTGEKIAMLTGYDFLTAKYLDQVGIDIILVGDSLGNVVLGYETTLPVTVDDMIYHAKAVKRAVKNALIVVDMPFMSFQTSLDDAVRNAGRIMKEVGVGAVKLEGGEYIADIVRHLVKIGIPVMGHLGLTPQAINKFGTYEVRAKDHQEADELVHDAEVLAEAGAFALVLEKIPAALARRVTETVPIPTIGIGAGPHCDGQVLVVYDMLGLTEEFRPRFVRRYAELAEVYRGAFRSYIADVRSGRFPRQKESY
jgi:3-methyl-2-oxobutanoate hydroxymethyltransferase